MIKSVNVFLKINVGLYKKAVVSVSVMKRRYRVILKKLLESSVLIENSSYELFVSVKKQKDGDFVEWGRMNPTDVVFIQCVFLEKETQKPLLVFNAERWFCSIKKSEVYQDVYENYLANVSSIERKENVVSVGAESNWWITLNEFINAVHYVVNMKNGMKEIVSRDIA